MLTKHKQKERTEERASGIDCEETEVDAALADILEKERLADQEREKDATVTAKKNASDKAAAEEVRVKAMERLGATKRRHDDDADGQIAPPKGRRKTSDVYLYLKEKHERDRALQNEELDWRKKEQEQRVAHQETMETQNKQLQKQQQDMLSIMQQQQQNFQALLMQQHQQQQQQNQLMVSILNKIQHSWQCFSALAIVLWFMFINHKYGILVENSSVGFMTAAMVFSLQQYSTFCLFYSHLLLWGLLS